MISVLDLLALIAALVWDMSLVGFKLVNAVGCSSERVAKPKLGLGTFVFTVVGDSDGLEVWFKYPVVYTIASGRLLLV